jgi:hypothetical protein
MEGVISQKPDLDGRTAYFSMPYQLAWGLQREREKIKG